MKRRSRENEFVGVLAETEQRTVMRIEIALFTSPGLSDWEFISVFAETYRSLMAEGIPLPKFIIHYEEVIPINTCTREHILQCKQVYERKLESAELWYLGTPVSPRIRVEVDATWRDSEKCGYRMCLHIAYCYDRGCRIRYTDVKKTLLSLCKELRAVYGYAKIVRKPTDTWANVHDPLMGPARLEWLNWFGDQYCRAFERHVQGEIPGEEVRMGEQQGRLVQIGDQPMDYYSAAGRLRRWRYRRKIGMMFFMKPRPSYLDWLILGIGRDKPAKWRIAGLSP